MLGRSHVVMSGAGYVTAAILVPSLVGQAHVAPLQLAAGTVIAGAGGLLPDLDHPEATISRSIGPLTKVLSRTTNKLMGGHRQGTHSLLFIVALAIGLYISLLQSDIGKLVSFAIVALGVALLLDAFTKLELIERVCGALVIATITSTILTPLLIIPALLIGVALHDAADSLTPEGVPVLWPVKTYRFRLPLVRTGSAGELLLCSLVELGVTALVVMTFLHPHL
jgi:membrane-bound metal-dependent hydrolase YbcI (DUF457 family)